MESVPFGEGDRNPMGMPVAFSNALAVDLAGVRRLIWVSGQLAFADDGCLVGVGDVAAQTEQCLRNIQAYLERLGGTLADVVQVTVFVRDMDGLAALHAVRRRFFSPPYPTSTLVAVSGFVHPEALIEINAVAAVRA
jgi:enamine deaminase RidA (YjgF/YER057c/UK114 family)